MRCRLPTALPYMVRSIDNHKEKYDVRNTCVTTLKMNAEKWFEGEESCTDWEGIEKHDRKLKKDEKEIENTPEEDMLAKGTQFYNREGRISKLISNMWLDLYLLGSLVPDHFFLMVGRSNHQKKVVWAWDHKQTFWKTQFKIFTIYFLCTFG